MKRPVIFFDWDGTIADSMPLCVGEITLALERMGLSVPPVETLMACNGPTYEESVAVLGLPQERGAEFLRLRKPILAICRGIQVLNVALGGTLYLAGEAMGEAPYGELIVRGAEAVLRYACIAEDGREAVLEAGVQNGEVVYWRMVYAGEADDAEGGV